MAPISPRYRKVVRDLSSHWFRTTLVVLSIAIGIFAVGVVLGGREILLREFDSDFTSSAPASATFRVTDFDEATVDLARMQEGVSGAQGRRSTQLRYRWTGDADERTLSVEAFRDFNDIEVAKVSPDGDAPWPPAEGEIVLEGSVRQVGDYRIGDVLDVETASGETVELRVAGFAHDINSFPSQFGGFETGYVSFETIKLLGETDKFNQLSLAFDDGDISHNEASRSAARVRRTVFEAEGLTVFYTDVPEPGSHFLGDIFSALSLLLLALGALSLGLSAFLVVNTVSALMAQQVRQVGIMKAIGGRAGQLERLYVTMVTAYGLLACAVGIPLTAVATRWFANFAADILNFRVTDYSPPAWVIAVEVGVGLLVPLLAAAGPVRRGVRMSVARALNGSAPTTLFGHGLVDRALGAIRGLPRPVALALRNTFIRKGRLALTLSTLVLASAVVMSVWSVQASIETTMDDLETWWRYNVQFTFSAPQEADAVRDVAEAVDGVEATEAWPVFPAALVRDDGSENESFRLVGLDPDTDFVGPTIVEGRWLESGDDNEIVLNTDAVGTGESLSLGREVTLKVAGEQRTWTVVGVVKGQLGGPAIYCNEEFLTDVTGDAGVTRLLVRGESDGGRSERRILNDVEEALADAGFPVSDGNTRSELNGQVRDWLGILVAFLVIMAVLLASVGVIGLTGTMTINVLESTREIGVMRATGAQHRAIYQIFIAEGLTVGAISWSMGALLAYPMSYWLVRALQASISVPLTYTFSWWGVAAWLALMLAISALASIAPAFRASQVSVRDAIAYE